MLKIPNSFASFFFSLGSLAILLDYMLWPKTIRANESLEQGVQAKMLGFIIFLALSLYFKNKAKLNEKENGWLKVSGIMNTAVFSIIVLSFLFYMFIEITR